MIIWSAATVVDALVRSPASPPPSARTTYYLSFTVSVVGCDFDYE